MRVGLMSSRAAIAAALVLACASAFAERAMQSHRVEFAQGRSGATMKGHIVGDEIADYRLRVRAGQTLGVRLLASGATTYYNVLPPGSTGVAIYNGSIDGDTSTTTLPADGEYTIRVYQMGHAKSAGQRSTFALEVSVTGGAPSAASGVVKPAEDPMVEAAGRAGEGRFNATGKIPCAQAPSQPMGLCDFGVARAGGGTAVVSVTMPGGRKRMLMFSKGKAIGADLSQADGNMTFSATKVEDLFKIQAGRERYEMPEAVIFGG